MRRPTTLQDIADRVGVARATVSLALSGKGRMSAETREHIRRVAAELEYVPNSVARNLRSSRSGTIGLYMPDNPLSYRYYMEVAYGAVKRAQEADLLVALVPSDVHAESRFEQHLDGFIVMDPDDTDPIVRRLLEGDRPVVSGEWAPAGLPAPSATVFSDNRRGIRMLLEHVAERGATAPFCLFPPATASWARELIDGYETWSAERGLTPRMATLSATSTPAAIREQVIAAAGPGTGVDALVCAAEGAAALALDALRAVGVAVGPEMLLASYIDSDAFQYTTPAITSLDLNPRLVGAECVAALARVLDTPGEPFAVEVPLELHARASTLG